MKIQRPDRASRASGPWWAAVAGMVAATVLVLAGCAAAGTEARSGDVGGSAVGPASEATARSGGVASDAGSTPTSSGTPGSLTDTRAADPDHPLQGTAWQLDGIIRGSGPSASVSSVPAGIDATLRIVGGRIRFSDGMNHYDGPTGADASLTVGRDTVRISGEMAGTAIGCASGRTCSVDMSVLMHDFHYSITGDRLTVTGTGSTAGKGLIFVTDDAPPSATAQAPGEPPRRSGSPVAPLPGTGTSGAAPTGESGTAARESGTAADEPATTADEPGTTADKSGPGMTSPPGRMVPTAPVKRPPIVSPGQITPIPSTLLPRSPSGRHDSLPPQPAPDRAPDRPSQPPHR